MSFLALWLGVGVLGGAGAVARVALDALVSANAAGRFPLGTLLVNLSGALVLGVLAGMRLSSGAHLLAGTAVVGSYTTFSTWMLESHRLAEDGRRTLLAANVLLSLALGLGAAALGRVLAGG
ncbi:MAG TPA: fluoride efflux transporter CrcB [Solirubrobacteraceae bacterium]|nr:fluoride efflux transporter CrcB [Solirubrobacteraceae bacterium]